MCNNTGDQPLCNEDCENCFHRSFASHPMSKFWSNTNELKPRNVFNSDTTKYLFDCDVCDHSFYISPNNICNGKFCPYCENQKLCDNMKCTLCYEKSFASQKMAQDWSVQNNLMPREVPQYSNKRYIFDCHNCGNSYKISISQITNYDKNCPHCA